MFGRNRSSNRTQSSASKQADTEVAKELEGLFDKPTTQSSNQVDTQSKFDALDKELKKDSKSDNDA